MTQDGWRSLVQPRRAWSRLPWRRRCAPWTFAGPYLRRWRATDIETRAGAGLGETS